MRRRERERIIEKTEDFSRFDFGSTLYFRPFEPDDKKIAEIAKFTGEKKSVIAQRLVHLALAEKEIEFSESRVEEKIDWLVKNARQIETLDESTATRLNDVCDALEKLETRTEQLSKDSERISALTLETFCMTSIAISSLNQIFTKVLEFLSPVEIERTCSVDVANQAMAALIEHSVHDVERCVAHHGIDDFDTLPDDLFIYSKIGKLRNQSTVNGS